MKYAFTLAEVLITLVIIGVVAAMTLPSLIQKNQDKKLISRTKKVYSDVNNALLLAQRDLGTIGDNSILFNTTDNNQTVLKNLQKYFSGAKYCQNKYQKDCSKYYYDIKYATLRLNEDNSAAVDSLGGVSSKLILSNGAIIAVNNSRRPDCMAEVTEDKKDEYGRPIKDEDGNVVQNTYIAKSCGQIYFDVNGPKGPNQYGRDTYQLLILKTGTTYFQNAAWGAQSLKNILTGNEKLEYENYSKGQVFEF